MGISLDGALVAFNWRNATNNVGQKEAVGIITESGNDGGKSVRVRVLLPSNSFTKNNLVSVPVADLMVLSKNQLRGGNNQENLLKIIISLIRELEGAKKEIQFLREASKSL